jgi:hypothetical protein
MWYKVCQSRSVKNSVNPNFAEAMVVSQFPGQVQTLEFHVYNAQAHQVGIGQLLGSVEVNFQALLDSQGAHHLTLKVDPVLGARTPGRHAVPPVIVVQTVRTNQATALEEPAWYARSDLTLSAALRVMKEGRSCKVHKSAKGKGEERTLVWVDGPGDGILYWKGKDNRLKKQTSLSVGDITHVLQGKRTPSLEFVKGASERRCLSIVTPAETLEVELDTPNSCEYFYKALQTFITRCSFNAALHGDQAAPTLARGASERREVFLEFKGLNIKKTCVWVYESGAVDAEEWYEVGRYPVENGVCTRSVVVPYYPGQPNALQMVLYNGDIGGPGGLGEELVASARTNLGTLISRNASAKEETNTVHETWVPRAQWCNKGTKMACQLLVNDDWQQKKSKRMWGRKEKTDKNPRMYIRVAPRPEVACLRVGAVPLEECVDAMQKGQLFSKEAENSGKSSDRTVWYQKGEMGGTLAWGPVNGEQVVQEKHSLPIHTITRVFEGQDDLTFTVVSTYRLLTLEAREAHTRDLFIHGLRGLLAQCHITGDSNGSKVADGVRAAGHVQSVRQPLSVKKSSSAHVEQYNSLRA